MGIAEIGELISTLGFPIALVVAMGFFIWKIYQQSVKREEALVAVNEKAINTLALYAEKLEVIQNDVSTIKEKLNSN
jgi:hypothetical protein